MNTTRVARNISAAVVAGIAAYSSYSHMVAVALSVGERTDVAHMVPLSVDGMLVVASVAMVDDRRAGRSVRWSAKVAFTAGVVASVAANVAAAHPTIGARIVAAWPALALLLTVELLTRAGKKKRDAATEPEAVPVPPSVAIPATPALPHVERQIPAPAAVPRKRAEPVPVKATGKAVKGKTDEQLLRILANPIRVPRDPDGTVPIQRAARSLGTGTDRARKLLDQAGLLRTADEPASDPETTPHNGVRPELLDAVTTS